MKNVLILGLLILCLSAVGCQTNPVTSTSPYAGNWEIVIAGDIVGSKISAIDTNGLFSFSVFVTSSAGSYTSLISGSVEATTGKVSGYSYYGTSKSATIRGTMISSNSGSGTYTELPGYVGTGTWTMTKQ